MSRSSSSRSSRHRLPSLPALLPGWKHSPIPLDTTRLPPLLEIKSSKLAQQALRHFSYNWDPSKQNQEGMKHGKYEHELETFGVLESVGEQYLPLIVSKILRRKYPDLTSFPLSELRQSLVRDITISHLSLFYGLPSRLLHGPGREALTRDQKLSASLFEAHIGALYEDPEIPESRVEDWLKEVFSRRVWRDLEERKEGLKEGKLDAEKKRREERGQLAQKGYLNRWDCADCDSEKPDTVPPKPTFEYDPADARKGWHVRMSLEGEFISCGHALTKRAAESAALYNAVEEMEMESDEDEDEDEGGYEEERHEEGKGSRRDEGGRSRERK
ncbi:ribonuclease III domain-containing protein [Sporobolomyces salmoneus]|uniref:ribonuclease III domain-containing protein n=1 Tax=Sporobolomyces salmoneus TaxID=183962 RepID=UPI00316CF993